MALLTLRLFLIHGKNNFVSVTEYSLTWGPDENPVIATETFPYEVSTQFYTSVREPIALTLREKVVDPTKVIVTFGLNHIGWMF